MGRDEQKLQSIKILYNVNERGLYTIEYWLDIADFFLGVELFEFHKDNLYEGFLYNKDNVLIEDPITNKKYDYYRLESKDEGLHLGIDYIPFIEKGVSNTLEESLRANTNSKRDVP